MSVNSFWSFTQSFPAFFAASFSEESRKRSLNVSETNATKAYRPSKENRCKDNLWHRPSCRRTQGICRCHIHHELYLLPPNKRTVTGTMLIPRRGVPSRSGTQPSSDCQMQQPSTFEKVLCRVYDMCIPEQILETPRVFGTWYLYILEKASRKLDKGPSLESFHQKNFIQLHQKIRIKVEKVTT